jgi:hypothetical protein
MVEGTATAPLACLATVRLCLWENFVMLHGFSSASLLYLDALHVGFELHGSSCVVSALFPSTAGKSN